MDLNSVQNHCSYDSDEFIGDISSELNIMRAEPFLCWGRGLRKPKISEIPRYKILDKLHQHEMHMFSNMSSGRGRGASYGFKRCLSNEIDSPFVFCDRRKCVAHESGDDGFGQFEDSDGNGISEPFPCSEKTVEDVCKEQATDILENEQRVVAVEVPRLDCGDSAEIVEYSELREKDHSKENLSVNNEHGTEVEVLNDMNISSSQECIKDEAINMQEQDLPDVYMNIHHSLNDAKQKSRPSFESYTDSSSSLNSSKSSNAGCKNWSHHIDAIPTDSVSSNISKNLGHNGPRGSSGSAKRRRQKKNKLNSACKKKVLGSSDTNSPEDNEEMRSSPVTNGSDSSMPEKYICSINRSPQSPSMKGMDRGWKFKREFDARCRPSENITYSETDSESGSIESDNLQEPPQDDTSSKPWNLSHCGRTTFPKSVTLKVNSLEDDFPSLPSCKSNSSSANHESKKVNLSECNLKSVAESLFVPLSQSSSEKSSLDDIEIPGFLKVLSVNENQPTPKTASKTIAFALARIPGYTCSEDLVDLLQPYYGKVEDLEIVPCITDDTVTAYIRMTTQHDVKWVVENLHDTQLFGASSENVMCYAV